MTEITSMRVSGFITPLDMYPCFGGTIFGENSNYGQILNAQNEIIGFQEVAYSEKLIAVRENRVARIGDKAFYAFAFSPQENVVGTYAETLAYLKQNIDRLIDQPWSLLEIAEFSQDVDLKKRALRLSCRDKDSSLVGRLREIKTEWQRKLFEEIRKKS